MVTVEDFNRVVASRFAYLVHEHGFHGPDTAERGYAGYTAYRQAVGGNARTFHSMEKSAAMQADALRRVLPLLRGEGGRELMARAD